MNFKKYVCLFVILLSFFLVSPSFSATLLPYPKFQAVDSSGNPYSGGKVYTYISGSTTAKASYSNAACTTANANPVVLDSNGEATIYLKGKYKIVLKTSADVTVWTMDNIEGMGQWEGNSYADYNETDQGAVGLGSSIKDLIDAIGGNQGTIILSHNSGSTTTTYTVTTALTIPSNITLKVENGARLTESGTSTITINGPFETGRDQVFSGFEAGDVTFGAGAIKEVYPEWWATNTTPGTTSMATAIECALASGRDVEFLDNTTYLVDGTTQWLTVNSSQTITMGRNTTLKFTGTHADYRYGFRLNAVNNIKIIGGILDGDRDTCVSTYGIGIYITNGSYDITVEDVYAKNWLTYGFMVGSGIAINYNLKFLNDRTYNCGLVGLALTWVYNVWVDKGLFDTTTGSSPQCGIDVEPNAGETASRIFITNTVTSNNTGNGIYVQTGSGTTTDIQVLNCLSHTNGSYGISFNGVTRGVLNDNESYGNTTGGLSVITGIDLTITGNLVYNNPKNFEANNIRRSTITGNIFKTSVDDSNVVIRDSGGTGSNLVTFSGNIVDLGDYYGLELDDSTNLLIVGNTISNSLYEGINLANVDNSSIIGNQIINNCTDGGNHDSIAVGTDSDSNNVQGNTVRSATGRYGINVSVVTADDNFVTNNDLLNSGATGALNDAGTGTITAAGNRS